MKKKILLFAMVLFVICLLTICVGAAEVDGIYYSFTNTDAYPGYDGTATVTSENRTKGTLTEIIIPEIVEYDSDDDGVADKKYIVTAIDGSAFGSTGGTSHPAVSVFIPKTVKSIGQHAFRQLQQLEMVVIEARGYNPSTGEDYTAELNFTNAEFYSCPKLLSVDMSNSNVVQVGDNCFSLSSSLHTVLFSKNIKRIYGAFTNCSSLTTINSLESLEEIGRGFYNTKISGDIVCPNLKSLGEHAFRETNITSVDFSGSTFPAVSSYAFRACSNLERVVLPETVTTIGTDAFVYCSKLTSINLPRGITSFGNSAFWGPKFSGDLIFDTVVSIGTHAFRETNITSLVILNGTIKGENGEADQVLTSLNTNASLYGCTKLEILVLPDTVTTAGANTFTNCNALKYIVASENFTSISSKPAKADIIITGTSTSALESAWSGWSVVPFSEFDPANAGTKTIYYGAVPSANPTTFIVFDGYDKSFSCWDAITNTKTEYSSIFEASGYSTSSDNSGIATGFKVNHDSLSAYETLMGKKITFGVVVFNPKYLGSASVFTSDGVINATKGALQVALDLSYTNCNLSISGMSLDNAEHASLELVFAGYAYTGDDASTIQVFQKEYVGTAESPVSSPMASKVSRGDNVLYTVKLQSIVVPSPLAGGKDSLNEFIVA